MNVLIFNHYNILNSIKIENFKLKILFYDTTLSKHIAKILILCLK